MSQHKKKILHLITQAEFGGSQKYVFNVVTKLSTTYTFIVAAGELKKGKELLNRLDTHNIKTVPLKRVVRSINPLFDIFGFFEIVALIRREQPDIIHLHSSKMSILGSFAAHYANFLSRSRSANKERKESYVRPIIIYTAHGFVFTEKINAILKWFYIFCERRTSRLKDYIIVLSQIDKDLAHLHSISPRRKIVVIRNGVTLYDDDFYDTDRARHTLYQSLYRCDEHTTFSTRGFIVGTIANLYPNKGLPFFISAIEQLNILLKDTGFDMPVQCVIIGDGMLHNELSASILEKKLEQQVFLAGSIKDAYKLLKAFDLFILSSLKEGIPFALLEAMSAKVPIIATHVGAIPEILEHQKTAILVPPGNAEVLTENMHELLHHPETRKSLAHDAYQFAKKNLTEQSVFSALSELYSN